ncbi:hypothetical protein [Stenotrophomonas sp. YAU14D1_LEIMI4_1]|uniref:hypothetical protein n=1 Tax=Stenotrophomonas sp. YAU14D1_LEIMI4_1 TaxID=2072407 RepID=UPI000D53E49E|nr:hypothetical protein [Stenotrophomonas sp. YAU14D1_LEIMI4_1]AWH27409.1 hypothetical protein C1932_17260 [Stenotrophomonas sp. YAU14D1_LEIMI4_1]
MAKKETPVEGAGHGADQTACDFPPLLDWNDVMRDELEDRWGFARRATFALLTQSGAGLVEGFAGENRPGLEGARSAVALFREHLLQMQVYAEAAEGRLQQVARVLAVDD